MKGMEATWYSATVLCTFANGAIFFRSKKNLKTFTLNIEWDIDLEEFVVKMPQNSFAGVKERRIKPGNLGQIKDDKDCLYYDKATGERFATINRGMWYN